MERMILTRFCCTPMKFTAQHFRPHTATHPIHALWAAAAPLNVTATYSVTRSIWLYKARCLCWYCWRRNSPIGPLYNILPVTDNLHALVCHYPLWGDKVSMLSLIYTHTNPWGKLKWPHAITRLAAHYMCGLMSDLVICNSRKSMVIHDTECHYWDRVSLNNTNQPTNLVCY